MYWFFLYNLLALRGLFELIIVIHFGEVVCLVLAVEVVPLLNG